MFSTGGRALQGGTGGPGGGTGGPGGSNETFPSNLLPLCYAEVTMYHPSPMGPACLASNKYATRFMMTECTLVSNSSGSPPMWGRLGCNSSTYGGLIMFSSPTCDDSSVIGDGQPILNYITPSTCSNGESTQFVFGQPPIATTGLEVIAFNQNSTTCSGPSMARFVSTDSSYITQGVRGIFCSGYTTYSCSATGAGLVVKTLFAEQGCTGMIESVMNMTSSECIGAYRINCYGGVSGSTQNPDPTPQPTVLPPTNGTGNSTQPPPQPSSNVLPACYVNYVNYETFNCAPSDKIVSTYNYAFSGSSQCTFAYDTPMSSVYKRTGCNSSTYGGTFTFSSPTCDDSSFLGFQPDIFSDSCNFGTKTQYFFGQRPAVTSGAELTMFSSNLTECSPETISMKTVSTDYFYITRSIGGNLCNGQSSYTCSSLGDAVIVKTTYSEVGCYGTVLSTTNVSSSSVCIGAYQLKCFGGITPPPPSPPPTLPTLNITVMPECYLEYTMHSSSTCAPADKMYTSYSSSGCSFRYSTGTFSFYTRTGCNSSTYGGEYMFSSPSCDASSVVSFNPSQSEVSGTCSNGVLSRYVEGKPPTVRSGSELTSFYSPGCSGPSMGKGVSTSYAFITNQINGITCNGTDSYSCSPTGNAVIVKKTYSTPGCMGSPLSTTNVSSSSVCVSKSDSSYQLKCYGGVSPPPPPTLLPVCYLEQSMHKSSTCAPTDKYATVYGGSECTLQGNSGSEPRYGRVGCNSSTDGGMLFFSSPTCEASSVTGFYPAPISSCNNGQATRFVQTLPPVATKGMELVQYMSTTCSGTPISYGVSTDFDFITGGVRSLVCNGTVAYSCSPTGAALVVKTVYSENGCFGTVVSTSTLTTSSVCLISSSSSSSSGGTSGGTSSMPSTGSQIKCYGGITQTCGANQVLVNGYCSCASGYAPESQSTFVPSPQATFRPPTNGTGNSTQPPPQSTFVPSPQPTVLPPTNGTGNSTQPPPQPSSNVLPACYVNYVNYETFNCAPSDKIVSTYNYAFSGSSQCTFAYDTPMSSVYKRTGCNSSTYGGTFTFSSPTCDDSSFLGFQPDIFSDSCNFGTKTQYFFGQRPAVTSGAELTMFSSNLTECSPETISMKTVSTDYFYITRSIGGNLCNGQSSYTCSSLGDAVIVKTTYSEVGCYGTVLSTTNVSSSSVCIGAYQLKCFGGITPPPPSPPPTLPTLNITVMPECYLEYTMHSSSTCAPADKMFTSYSSSGCSFRYSTGTFSFYTRTGCNSSTYGGEYMFSSPSCDASSVVSFNPSQSEVSGTCSNGVLSRYVEGKPPTVRSGSELTSFYSPGCSGPSMGKGVSTSYAFITNQINGITCNGTDSYSCSPTGNAVIVKKTYSTPGCMGSPLSTTNVSSSSVCVSKSDSSYQLKCYGGVSPPPPPTLLPVCYLEQSMHKSSTCAPTDKYATVYSGSECTLQGNSGSEPRYGRVGCNSSTDGGMFFFSSPTCEASSVTGFYPAPISSCNNGQATRFVQTLPPVATKGMELVQYMSTTCSGTPISYGVSTDFDFITGGVRLLVCNGTVAYSCSPTGAALVVRTVYSESGCFGTVVSTTNLTTSECFISSSSSSGGTSGGTSSMPSTGSQIKCYGGVSAPSQSNPGTGGGGGPGGGTGGPGGGSNETFPSNLLPLCYAEVTMYHPSPMGPACLASNKYATRFMMTECTLVSNSSGSPPMWGRLGCNSSTYGGLIMFSSPTCDDSSVIGDGQPILNYITPSTCSNGESTQFVFGQPPIATTGLEVIAFNQNSTTCSGPSMARFVSTDSSYITQGVRGIFCSGYTTYSCSATGAGIVVKTLFAEQGCTGMIESVMNMTSSECIGAYRINCYGGVSGGGRLLSDVDSAYRQLSVTENFYSLSLFSSSSGFHSRYLQGASTSTSSALKCVPTNGTTPQTSPSATPVPRVITVLPVCHIQVNAYQDSKCSPSDILYTNVLVNGCRKVDNPTVLMYTRYGCNATHAGVFFFSDAACSPSKVLNMGDPFTTQVLSYESKKCMQDPTSTETSPPFTIWTSVVGLAPVIRSGLEMQLFSSTSNASTCIGSTLGRFNATDFYFVTDKVRSLTCSGQEAYSCSPTGVGRVVRTRYAENGCFGSIISSTILAQTECIGDRQYKCYGVPQPNITCGKYQIAVNGYCACASGFISNATSTSTSTTTTPLVCVPNCPATLFQQPNSDNSGCVCRAGYRPSTTGCIMITCGIFEQLTTDFQCVCNRGFFKPINSTVCTSTPKSIVVTSPVGGVVRSNVTNSVPPVPFAVIREGEKSAATFDVYLLEALKRFDTLPGDVVNVSISLEPVSTTTFNPNAFVVSPRMLSFSATTPQTQKVSVSASANLFAGDFSSIICVLKVQRTSNSLTPWINAVSGSVVFTTEDATPAKIFIPSVDDKGRPSSEPASFTITDGGAGSTAFIPVSLTAIPPAGVTVTLRIAASSLTVKTDKTTLFFTQSNWNISQMVMVSADATFATIAVSNPISITVSTATAYNGPPFEQAGAKVTLVRASSLAPRIWSPVSVTKGSVKDFSIALGNVPVSAVNATIFLDVSKAPINGRQVRLEIAEQPARFIIFDASNAMSNTSVALFFASNPYATFGEFVRVCISMLGFQTCSSPISLIDTVVPAISPIRYRNLFSGNWNTFLEDGTTLRIREGSSTLVNFSIATQIIGRLSASLSISSGFEFAMAGTSQTFATATSNNVVLSITGRVQNPPVDPSFTNRTGNFTITIQPDTKSSTLLQDSGYANPPLRHVIQFVLINPGASAEIIKPTIKIEGPIGASSFIEGDDKGLTINVTVSPPPSDNTKVVIKVVAPSLTSASSYELEFTRNVTKLPVTLKGLEDLIANDLRTSKSFSFSVSDKTDSLEHLQLSEVIYAATMIDNDVPRFNVSSLSHVLTEGGDDTTFLLSLTASPPEGQSVTAVITNATGVCLASPASLLSLNIPCMKNSDCPTSSPFCRSSSVPMFSLVTAIPQSVSFSSADWSVPRIITLRAPRDGLATGSDKKAFVGISFAPTTTLTSFQVVRPVVLNVSITDVDIPGGSFVESSNALFVEGSSSNVDSRIATLRLNTVPLAPVTISVSSKDTAFVVYSGFTNTPGSPLYSFSSGVRDDKILRGNVSDGYKYFVPIEFTLTSTDPAYSNRTIKGLRTIVDDERAGVDITIPIGAVLEEGGSNSITGSFKLKSQPVQDVVITIVEVPSDATYSLIDDSCAKLPTTGSQLRTLTDGNIFKFTYKSMDTAWDSPKFFLLSARADGRKDNNVAVEIEAQISSLDPNYNSLPPTISSVKIVENDLVDPPVLTNATFDSSYDSLTMTFNKKISAGGTQFECATLFQVFTTTPSASNVCKTFNITNPEVIATNTRLGVGSYCTQISDTVVKVVLGSITRPTIVAGNIVLLNYGVIRASSTAIRTASGSIVVSDSSSKPRPIVTFSSSEEKLDSCSNKLIGPSISGTGGRPFTIQWTASSSANMALQSEISLLNSKKSTSLFIDVTRLSTGSTVNITVTVTNWLGEKSSGSILVSRETAAKPKVELAETATYKRSETFSVSIASATLSTCGTVTSASGLEFYWFDLSAGTPIGSSALYEGTVTTAISSLPFYASASTNGKYLKFSTAVRTATFINGLALSAGTYTIGVYTLSKQDNSYTFKTQTVTIINDDLVALIENGVAVSIDLGTSSASTNQVTFIATGSGEPTETLRQVQSGLVFTWSTDCANPENCVLSSSTSTPSLINAVYTISSTVSEFTVTLTVSGSGRTSASTSQKVKFSSTPVPKVSLSCTTMTSFGAIMPAIDNKFFVTASATGYSSFTYSWYAGIGSAPFPEYVTKSSSDFITINPMENLAEGSSYSLCVAATATNNPQVTSFSCFPFATAAAPSVGPVTIVLQNSASTGNTYSISTETLSAVVSSTSFAYLSTDLSMDYNISAIAAGYTSAEAYVKAKGIEEAKMVSLASFDSAVPSYSTTKIASGYHIVCIFGYNSAGSFDLSCSSIIVPVITLTTDDQKNALSDALKGGDSGNILAEIEFILGNDQAKSGSGGRRLSQERHLQSLSLDTLNTINIQSSMTADAIDAVLSTLNSVYTTDIDVASGGQGDNLASILNSLRSNVPALLYLGNSTLFAMCYSLAKKSVSSMNTLQANFITTGALENAAFALCACGTQLSCSSDVASLLAAGSNAQKFSTSISYTSGATNPYFYITGSSGVLSSRESLPLLQNTFTVSAAAVSQAIASENGYTTPSLVALYGSSIVGPSNAISGTTPVEIRALGHSTRTSTDKTPVIAVTVTGVTIPSGKTIYAAYTNGATQTVSYSNAATSCIGSTCTIYSKSTSTYALVAENPCSIIISSSDEYGATPISSASITEGVTSTFYVYLTRQPEAPVSVSISLKSGICYITDTNAMVTNGGYAVTCSVSSDCISSGASQDCRSQIATLKSDAANAPSSSVTLTFTSTNYASSQSVFVTGITDNIFENEASVQSTISLVPTSTDSRFDSVGVCTDASCTSSVGNAGSSININIVDKDTASIIVSALSSSSRSEGQVATFTVKLSSKPKATVTISVTESTSAVTFDINTLSFTTNNWDTAQIVTVTVVEDNLVNGARSVSIVTSATSSDEYFSAKTSTATLSITDNDVASISFTTFAPANIDQAGDNAKSITTIKLGAQPTEDVIVTVSYTSTFSTLLTASGSGVSGTAYASPITVTISPNNWNTGVTLTLTSESDSSSNPNAVVTLSMTTTSSQSAFNGLTPATTGTFTVINSNSGSVVPAMSSFTVSEAIAGGSSYTVSLSKATTDAVVTVSITTEVPSSSAPYEVPFTISPSTLTWNLNDMSAQTVTVTPKLDDNIAIPPGFYFFIVHNITSGPPTFLNNGAIKEMVSWVDNDTPSIVITPTAFTITEYKDDNAAAFFLSLGTQPVTTVTITCSSPFAGAVLNKTSFVFTSSNYNVPQKVWVIHNGTIFHDMDGQHLVTITAKVSAGDYAAPSLSVSSVSTVVTLPNPTPSPTPSVSPSPAPWNVSCPIGEYYSQSRKTCIACPGGKTSSPGDLVCSSCSAGTYSDPAGGVKSCTNCAPGTYSASGATSCTSCNSGFYSASGASVCTQCIACSGSQYQTSACTTTSNTVCQTCTSCTGNKYITTECSTNADAVCSDCKTCSASEYRVSSCSGKSNTVCASCSTCSANEYVKTACSASANTVCSTCSTRSEGQYMQTACSASADAVYKTCTVCEGATPLASSQCTATTDTVCAAAPEDGSLCDAGKFGPIGESSCTDCEAGYYSSLGATSCSICPAGKYSSLRASSCTNCTAGYFSNTNGAASCTICPAGQYSASGATSCINCATGTYSASGASSCTSCKKCSTGEYQSGGSCSTSSDSITCSKCTVCSSTQDTTTSCTATRDTVCTTKNNATASTPTPSPSPSPSVKPSVNPAAPSINPPTATEPVVQVVLSFSNIPETAFETTAGVASLEASIAKAAKVDAKTVKVARVYNLDTKKVIFTAARRLANANLEVTTKITTDSVSSATTLGATLKSTATTFGASVLSDLKTKDSVTFQSATISVKADSILVPSPKSSDSTTSSGLPLGAIIGIAVGGAVVAIAIFGGLGYTLYSKYGAPAPQPETSSFEFQSPMLNNPNSPRKVIGRGSRAGATAGHVDKVFKSFPPVTADGRSDV
jgi:hypothetical protein